MRSLKFTGLHLSLQIRYVWVCVSATAHPSSLGLFDQQHVRRFVSLQNTLAKKRIE